VSYRSSLLQLFLYAIVLLCENIVQCNCAFYLKNNTIPDLFILHHAFCKKKTA
jgi:hypothetical protein